MRREVIKASEGHEKGFRETWRLREDVENDPIWKLAYEHAATHALYPDEINAIGPVLVWRGAILLTEIQSESCNTFTEPSA